MEMYREEERGETWQRCKGIKEEEQRSRRRWNKGRVEESGRRGHLQYRRQNTTRSEERCHNCYSYRHKQATHSLESVNLQKTIGWPICCC
ncbi:hypothetical protein OS493_017295 [Desmophyllum pertusum]|uniref:Uncharacterized protein n=1 Tax=Desmophyllum pertusum TaxID=174260 RepID=A0A9X0A291_9CNID|nr:hypothetical protein OS493_017295 [Desmophyllum pertusum]